MLYFITYLGWKQNPKSEVQDSVKGRGRRSSEWGAIKRARCSRCIKSIMLTGAAA
jgi:hypothetical protein